MQYQEHDESWVLIKFVESRMWIWLKAGENRDGSLGLEVAIRAYSVGAWCETEKQEIEAKDHT